MKLSLHLSAIYLSDCCYLFTGIAMNHSLRPLELYGKCLLHAVVFEISHSSMERNTSNDLMRLMFGIRDFIILILVVWHG
jgi:hypothetical protein